MNPFAVLLILFFTIPLIEIYIIIEVGSVIGAIPTISLVVFTAVLGALLLRLQGFATLRRFQMSLARGQVPALELMEGVALVMGGALLLTPGFFTDAIGFLCLMPPVRQAVIRRIINRHLNIPGQPTRSGPDGQRTIEGEFSRDDN